MQLLEVERGPLGRCKPPCPNFKVVRSFDFGGFTPENMLILYI